MNTAFIFPGQASQFVGMGKDIFDVFFEARNTFEQADDILGYSLSKIIFDGPLDELSLTIHTQPAIATVSAAIINVILSQSRREIDQLCSIVAGHSLGEYSALYAANAISFHDMIKLLKVRASSMNQAALFEYGVMAACLGTDKDTIQTLIDTNIRMGVCQVANDNGSGQVVISGHEDNVNKIIDTLHKSQVRAMKLKVNGAFHSNLMKPAEIPMKDMLDSVYIAEPSVPIISNCDAKPTKDPKIIKENLLKQICSTVLWDDTMNKFNERNVNLLVEIGPGNVLSKLSKRSIHYFNTCNISNIDELSDFLNSIA